MKGDFDAWLRDLERERAAERSNPEAYLTFRNIRLDAEELLSDGPEVVTSMGMEREQVSDMIAATDAQAEARLERMLGEVKVGFAEIRGEIKAQEAKIAALPSKWTVYSATFGAAVALAAFVLGAMALAGDQFDTGRDVGGQIAEISAKLDRLQPPPQTPPAK